MSLCEHMLETCDSQQSGMWPSPEEKLLNIQNELLWGLTYRNYKEHEKNKPLLPVHSPIHVPFELCRAKMLMSRKSKRKHSEAREEQEGQGRGDEKDSRESGEVGREFAKTRFRRKKDLPVEKPTLLDRNVWSQSKYMDFLSIPSPKFEEPERKKYKKRCELEPCPPRFVQLAVPNKRRVFANWKDYARFLPPEMLMRFEEILHTDQNLEPREARYYYKKLDREKKAKLKKKRLLEKKRKLEQEKEFGGLKIHIDTMADQILQYLKDEPLFALNYKQMLLSDGILDRLEQTHIMKRPSRKTKNHYKRTVIEVSDKLAIWIDTLTKFVDVQAIESDVDIPPVSISSLSEEGEFEGESEYESSEGEGPRDSQLFEPTEAWVEEGEDYGFDYLSAKDAAEAFMTDLLKPGEGEGATELDNLLNDLDGDALDKLIEILSNCSDEFLDSHIDDDKMPDVSYRDVLQRLRDLKEDLEGAGGKPFLEQILIDWALRNDPDKVNDEILRKIHEVAGLLGELLMAKKPESDRRDEIAGAEGEKDESGPTGDVSETVEPTGDVSDAVEKELPTDADVTQIADDQSPATEEPASGGEQATKDEESAPDTGASPLDVAAGEEKEIEGGEAPEKKTDGVLEDKTEGGEIPEGGEILEEKAEGGEIPEGKTVGGEVPEEKIEDATALEPAETEGGADEAQPEGDAKEEKKLFGWLKGKEKDGEPTTDGEEASYGFDFSEAEGAITPFEAESSVLLGEEGLSEYYEEEGVPGGEAELLAPPVPGEPSAPRPGVPPPPGFPVAVEGAKLDGRVIKGHKPSKVFEHSPDTVCCLSLKTWAVWLLEVTHNAHNWTQWMSCVIQKIREYASIIRGDVKESDGNVKVLRKAEWRKFIEETEESVVGWRQYSAHVKDLSQSIVDNFHGKRVNCCPKCLQDHLITNVVVAHDTLQALTEAISCAAYWQRCLDNLVDKTCGLTGTKKGDEGATSSEDESEDEVDLEEVDQRAEESGESVYEIEGLEGPEQPNMVGA